MFNPYNFNVELIDDYFYINLKVKNTFSGNLIVEYFFKVPKYDYDSLKSVRYTIEQLIQYLRSRFLHNENGPAYISYDKNNIIAEEIYCLNSIKHRIDGPSVLNYKNGLLKYKFYYFNGNFVNVNNDEDFKKFVKYNNIK